MNLIEKAKEALKNAYSPYSNVQVGAALKLKNGKIYTGCNIENASYTPTVCAERVAIFKAVSDGYKKGDFDSIAVTASWDGLAAPCGVCRQVLLEFFEKDSIIFMDNCGEITEVTLKELIPYSFTKDSLK